MVSAPSVPAIPVTDVDATAHLVADDAMAAGRRSGRYVALCGREVCSASLATAERARCPACHQHGQVAP